MKNFYILAVFSVVSIGLAVLFFFSPGIIGPIPYGTFTFGFATLICFWIALRLGTTGTAAGDMSMSSLISTMKAYFWIMGTFFFFDGIAHIGIPVLALHHYPNLSPSQFDLLAGHFHTFAHIFFFAGNAVLIRIPVSFINARWKNAASLVVVAFGVITVGWRFNHTDKLVSIFGPTIPPIILTDKASGLLFLVVNIYALLLPGFYLMYRGLRSAEHDVKVRAFLLGLGMAIFFSIGPVIDLVQNQYTQLLIHLLQASSFGLMGLAAFYSPKHILPPSYQRSPLMG